MSIRFNLHRVVLFQGLLLGVLTGLAIGQVQSTILGTVTDATGAMVAGAEVTIKNEGTNLERSMATDPNGDYRIAGLEAGFYEVKVSLAGFKTFVRTKVDLDLSQIKRVDVTAR